MRVSTALQIKATPLKPRQTNTKTKRILGNLTNVRGSKPHFSKKVNTESTSKKPSSSLGSIVLKLDEKEEPKIATATKVDKKTATVHFQDDRSTASQPQEEGQPLWQATVFRNVRWRTVTGTIRMTDRDIMFHPDKPSAIKPKKLVWSKLECYETKSLEKKNRHMLRLVLKNPSTCSIVLKLDSIATRDQMAQELERHLQLQKHHEHQKEIQKSKSTSRGNTRSTTASASAYYPIVRLVSCSENTNKGHLQGSLSLTHDYLVFEPACTAHSHHNLPNDTTIRIRWSKIQKHQLNCRTTKALLKINCFNHNAKKPIVFQLPTRKELKRLNKDMLLRLQRARSEFSSTPDVVVAHHQDLPPTMPPRSSTPSQSPMALPPCLLGPSQSVLACPHDKTRKRVTFQIPLEEKAVVSDFTTSNINATRAKKELQNTKELRSFYGRRIRRGIMMFLSLGLVAFNIALVTDTLGIGTESRRLMRTVQVQTKGLLALEATKAMPGVVTTNGVTSNNDAQVDTTAVEALLQDFQSIWDVLGTTKEGMTSKTHQQEKLQHSPNFYYDLIWQAGVANWLA